jgi:hypothetical protein
MNNPDYDNTLLPGSNNLRFVTNVKPLNNLAIRGKILDLREAAAIISTAVNWYIYPLEWALLAYYDPFCSDSFQ